MASIRDFRWRRFRRATPAATVADRMLQAVRLLMRTAPTPIRERLALRFFVMTKHFPEPAREQKFRAAGTPLMVGGCHATSFGPLEGPVALMTHGWSGRGLQLCAFIEPLVDAGYRVIAMDGPACGRNKGNSTSIPVWVVAIRAAIREVKPAVMVGHSFGSVNGILALDAENSRAKLLCLGGPADPTKIVGRFRKWVGAPPDIDGRFVQMLLKKLNATAGELDVAAAAQRMRGRLHTIVTTDDDDIPWEESVRIIEDAGGTSTILENLSHREIMWDRQAVEAGMTFLGGGSA
jgi:pimeloyl-ACP methyl ester carboxylesterase